MERRNRAQLGAKRSFCRGLQTDVINIILGANMSSRLFEHVREKKGLCYDISTETRRYHDSGGFLIHLGLDEKNILVALKSIFPLPTER